MIRNAHKNDDNDNDKKNINEFNIFESFKNHRFHVCRQIRI